MTDHEFAPWDSSDVADWVDDADVVVVGGGAGGMSAAIEAAASGAEVLIVETAGGTGGASALSGGFIYLGGGTAVQQACGVADDAESMFNYLVEATGPEPDRAKLSLYCEQSVAHFDWLVGCGLEFSPRMWTEPAWMAPRGYGLMYTGGENAYPFADRIRPAARGHKPELGADAGGERSAGWAIMTALTRTAQAAGVRERLDSAIERLVLDGGEVVGIQVKRAGQLQFVRARRGVVLATGGFGANEQMLAQHAPHLLGNFLVGTDNDRGNGIRVAQAAGAAVRHMDAGEASFPADPALLFRSLLLDVRGRRFINEDTYPGRTGQAALFTQGRQVFLLYDDEIDQQARRWASTPVAATWVSADLAELEAWVGLPPGALRSTVAEYNAGAERGEDPFCHKSPQWLKPLVPPYGLLDLRCAAFGIFTLGGLQTTTDGEVLHLDGTPIPGLYAAGRATNGIPAWGYLSGTSLGDSTYFGRRAGRAAAAARPA